jgi:hypothetical protein
MDERQEKFFFEHSQALSGHWVSGGDAEEASHNRSFGENGQEQKQSSLLRYLQPLHTIITSSLSHYQKIPVM